MVSKASNKTLRGEERVFSCVRVKNEFESLEILVSKRNKLFLSPAPASRSGSSSREPDDSMNLNIWCFLPEIPLRFEAPVKEAGNPVLQAFDVCGDEGVQVLPEGGKESLVFIETLDQGFALFRYVVDGLLNSHPAELHKNDDHVPSLPAGLLHVIRHNVLRKRYNQELNREATGERPTFDQETMSLAISWSIRTIGSSKTTSGRFSPFAYSIRTKHSLHPLASRRNGM